MKFCMGKKMAQAWEDGDPMGGSQIGGSGIVTLWEDQGQRFYERSKVGDPWQNQEW